MFTLPGSRLQRLACLDPPQASPQTWRTSLPLPQLAQFCLLSVRRPSHKLPELQTQMQITLRNSRQARRPFPSRVRPLWEVLGAILCSQPRSRLEEQLQSLLLPAHQRLGKTMFTLPDWLSAAPFRSHLRQLSVRRQGRLPTSEPFLAPVLR